VTKEFALRAFSRAFRSASLRVANVRPTSTKTIRRATDIGKAATNARADEVLQCRAGAQSDGVKPGAAIEQDCRKKNARQQQEEREHSGLPLEADLQRKTDQHDRRGDGVSGENAVRGVSAVASRFSTLLAP
jgi:hypothetical protein